MSIGHDPSDADTGATQQQQWRVIYVYGKSMNVLLPHYGTALSRGRYV